VAGGEVGASTARGGPTPCALVATIGQ
jgi:hypothetical protein